MVYRHTERFLHPGLVEEAHPIVRREGVRERVRDVVRTVLSGLEIRLHGQLAAGSRSHSAECVDLVNVAVLVRIEGPCGYLADVDAIEDAPSLVELVLAALVLGFVDGANAISIIVREVRVRCVLIEVVDATYFDKSAVLPLLRGPWRRSGGWPTVDDSKGVHMQVVHARPFQGAIRNELVLPHEIAGEGRTVLAAIGLGEETDLLVVRFVSAKPISSATVAASKRLQLLFKPLPQGQSNRALLSDQFSGRTVCAKCQNATAACAVVFAVCLIFWLPCVPTKNELF